MSAYFGPKILRGLLISLICMYIAACNSLSSQGLEASRKQIEQQAQQGDAESQYRLGLIYTHSAAPDYQKATQWYQRSAQQGHRDAEYMLGINYYVGQGVERDFVAARNWFQKAADQGQARAQYQLGEIYMNGRGVQKEQDWAARWYGKAAEQNHTEAQFSLGVAFARGLGLPINWVRACQWLLLADRSDHALARELQNRVCGDLSAHQQERAHNLADRWQPRTQAFYDDPPTIRYIQMRLQKLHYYTGYIDGVIGDQTRQAIDRYIEDQKRARDSVSNKELLKMLRNS